ncbi:MAG: hypothetical protein LBV29_09135 [Azoarcus sp.]|jgi:hypothetical protein|nr:hypothetical protein [Azoarcus sp.]
MFLNWIWFALLVAVASASSVVVAHNSGKEEDITRLAVFVLISLACAVLSLFVIEPVLQPVLLPVQAAIEAIDTWVPQQGQAIHDVTVFLIEITVFLIVNLLRIGYVLAIMVGPASFWEKLQNTHKWWQYKCRAMKEKDPSA